MMAFSDSNSDSVQSSNSAAISLAYILVTVGTFALIFKVRTALFYGCILT